MDLSREFKKSTILALIEGDSNNGTPDGNLNRDSPLFKVIGIRLLSEPVKRIEIEIRFDSDQGSLKVQDSRFFTFNYADLPAGAKTKLKDFYNWVVDKVVKVLPELSDGTEQ